MLQDDGKSQKSRPKETQVSQFMRASLKFNDEADFGR